MAPRRSSRLQQQQHHQQQQQQHEGEVGELEDQSSSHDMEGVAAPGPGAQANRTHAQYYS
jgi:hypothetical protein